MSPHLHITIHIYTRICLLVHIYTASESGIKITRVAFQHGSTFNWVTRSIIIHHTPEWVFGVAIC